MSKVKLAIIGNGMVGHRFIEDLLDSATALLKTYWIKQIKTNLR